ncbi:hypothetical protein BIV57_17150 [Mangrovactinospora gilvigrisea]|uniref:Membrane-anchored protein n=2 Tax=Mangrovactinospora gilvigrisea TaxID=1428644 RepID=A0A1J7C9H7_9ACTN|nr:hypothetical protein BIV57_17150 [Mangrovactinospora gilvigrisea]
MPAPQGPPTTGAAARALSLKVPEVTAAFWVTKVLTTGMGEVLSDWLAKSVNEYLAVVAAAFALVAALAAQLAARRYIAWLYWLAVVMVSVFGTMAADVMHVVVGIPYAVSTSFWAVALAVVLLLWRRAEGTLSVHSIRTGRRECWYWATVLCTFALGTAAGDLTAYSLGLGYLASAVLFAVVIAVPAVGHAKLGMGAIGAFWFAYIVTRPLGASLADWMAVPASRGGLDLGLGETALGWTLAIAVCVVYLAVTGRGNGGGGGNGGGAGAGAAGGGTTGSGGAGEVPDAARAHGRHRA